MIDLFCGAGGVSLGFHASGCRILAAVDVDETAARIYADNFTRLQRRMPPAALSGDEGNIEDLDLDRLLVGGRPEVLMYWFGVNATGSVEGYGERERNLGGGRGAVAHRRDTGRTHDGVAAGRP